MNRKNTTATLLIAIFMLSAFTVAIPVSANKVTLCNINTAGRPDLVGTITADGMSVHFNIRAVGQADDGDAINPSKYYSQTNFDNEYFTVTANNKLVKYNMWAGNTDPSWGTSWGDATAELPEGVTFSQTEDGDDFVYSVSMSYAVLGINEGDTLSVQIKARDFNDDYVESYDGFVGYDGEYSQYRGLWITDTGVFEVTIPAPLAVSGIVFFGSTPLEDILVELTIYGEETPILSTTTSPEGFYSFSDVAPGLYWVTAYAPPDQGYVPDMGYRFEVIDEDVTKDFDMPKLLTLLSPDDKAIVTTSRPTFSWESFPDAVRYSVSVHDKDDWVLNPVWEDTESTTHTLQTELSYGKEYGWSIYAYDSNDHLIGSAWPWWSFTITKPTRAMASFVIEHAKIDFKKKINDDKVKIKGHYELDLANGDGVNIEDDVTLTISDENGEVFSQTILMVEKGKGEKWEYKRPKAETGGIKHMTIHWKDKGLGKFDVKIDDEYMDGIMNPVTIKLEIGDHVGEEIIAMRIHKHHWDYKAKHADF